MTKEREELELLIGWDLSSYPNEIIHLVSTLKSIDIKISFLCAFYSIMKDFIEKSSIIYFELDRNGAI